METSRSFIQSTEIDNNNGSNFGSSEVKKTTMTRREFLPRLAILFGGGILSGTGIGCTEQKTNVIEEGPGGDESGYPADQETAEEGGTYTTNLCKVETTFEVSKDLLRFYNGNDAVVYVEIKDNADGGMVGTNVLYGVGDTDSQKAELKEGMSINEAVYFIVLDTNMEFCAEGDYVLSKSGDAIAKKDIELKQEQYPEDAVGEGKVKRVTVDEMIEIVLPNIKRLEQELNDLKSQNDGIEEMAEVITSKEKHLEREQNFLKRLISCQDKGTLQPLMDKRDQLKKEREQLNGFKVMNQ